MERKLKWLDEYCHICGEQLNTWDVKCSNALMYRKKTCEKCIAKEYDRDMDALRGYMESYFGMRPCQGL